jgi:hypothetical protein
MTLSPKILDLQVIKHSVHHFNAHNFQTYKKINIMYNTVMHILKKQNITLMLLMSYLKHTLDKVYD